MIFRKKKYYFDPATLTFEEVRADWKKKIIEPMLYMLVSVAVIMASGYWLNNHFDSPESHFLEKRASILNTELRHLFEKGSNISASLYKDHFMKDNHYRTILQIDTLSNSLREAGSGGSASDAANSPDNNMSYQIDNLLTKLHLQLQIQTGSYKAVFDKAQEHELQFSHMPAIIPISQNDLMMISSHFGVRSDPFLDQQEVHSGLDFVAAVGVNVYATGDGIVTFAQFSRTGYGNEIVIDHAFGFCSRYAHLSQILVTEGQKISRGQIVGKVGQSGRATGPHLHYEVLYENKPVNPSFYFDSSLTKEEYQKILKLASNKTN